MKNKKADNFTPGPWKVDSDGADVWVMKDHSGGQGIAAIFDVNGIAEMTANAALIAAAPELLAALEFCAEALDTEAGGLYKAHVEQARAAIAKAKGTK